MSRHNNLTYICPHREGGLQNELGAVGRSSFTTTKKGYKKLLGHFNTGAQSLILLIWREGHTFSDLLSNL